MASWTSLALLSALAVSALSLPDESAYKIPQVGTGRRSQYYVLHDDGTFKYGYDTGEGAYETSRLHHAGRQDGQFGYRDPDGNLVSLRYEAGHGGFQPVGTHIPAAHPDFYAAHAEASARPRFTDPLASSDSDASYNFNFNEGGQARQEQSDADGNVRGSYTYTDEEGRTRTYSYTAGRGTGFVIEGDDLPQAPLADGATPAATSLSSGAGASSAFKHSSTRTSSFRPSSFGSSSSGFTSSTKFGGSRGTYRRPVSSTHGSTQQSSFQTSRPVSTQSSFSSRTPSSFTTSTRASSIPSRPTFSTSSFTSHRQGSQAFEPANTRSQLNPDGSHTFAFETSSHSRSEAGDVSNNVDGKFDFVADDGQRRAIEYEAGSDTGFIAEGSHIPVGPPVPGSPSGQPTGRIVPVQEVPFVDPLADSDSDASYNFGFDSESYSRSESADADGNIQGRYTVVDDDGTRRTHHFRAGQGIGFEVQEVSSSRGSRPTSTSSSSSFSTGGAHSRFSSNVGNVVSYKTPSQTSRTRVASHSAQTGFVSSHGGASHGSAVTSGAQPVRPSFKVKPSPSQEVFPGFQLHQYDATEGHGKYGYVLKFDK